VQQCWTDAVVAGPEAFAVGSALAIAHDYSTDSGSVAGWRRECVSTGAGNVASKQQG
jgi:hypothetical protein